VRNADEKELAKRLCPPPAVAGQACDAEAQERQTGRLGYGADEFVLKLRARRETSAVRAGQPPSRRSKCGGWTLALRPSTSPRRAAEPRTPCWGTRYRAGVRRPHLDPGGRPARLDPVAYLDAAAHGSRPAGRPSALTLTRVARLFETNDDTAMNLIAAGIGFADQLYEHLVFTNVLLGLPLKAIYRVAPHVPWYGGYQNPQLRCFFTNATARALAAAASSGLASTRP
jgi:hypothetical protein